jgi:hypothetical protein
MVLGCISAGTKRIVVFSGAVASKTALTLTLMYPGWGSASEFRYQKQLLSHAGYVLPFA